MKTIWKYELLSSIDGKVFLNMPIGAEILSLQNQNNTPYIWALVDIEAEKEERCFEIFGTGHKIPCDMGIDRKFIGTFQMYNGTLIFHLFERL